MGLLGSVYKKVKSAGRSVKKGASAVGLEPFAEGYDVKHLLTDPKGYATDTLNATKTYLTRGAAVASAVQTGNYGALGGEAGKAAAGLARAAGAKVSKQQEAKLSGIATDVGNVGAGYERGGSTEALTQMGFTKNFGKLSTFAKHADAGVKLAKGGVDAYAAAQGALSGGTVDINSVSKATGALASFGTKNPLSAVSGIAAGKPPTSKNPPGKSSFGVGESATKAGSQPAGDVKAHGGIFGAINRIISSIFGG